MTHKILNFQPHSLISMKAGGNITINELGAIDLHISWLPQNAPIDVYAFVLNENEKVSSNEDLVSSAHPGADKQFLHLANGENQLNQFHINFSKIPHHVKKIVFAATTTANFEALFDLTIEVKNLVAFSPPLEATQSIILGELYSHERQWKFRAVGQGFRQGLSALADHFGLDVDTCLSKQREIVPIAHNRGEGTASPVAIIEEVITPAPVPSRLQLAFNMIKEMSWIWVAFSFFVFIILEVFLGGFVGLKLLGRFVPHVLKFQIEALLLLSSFLIGGVLVGLVSRKVRIIEPAIAAFISVVLTLSISFFSPYTFMRFTWNKVVVGGGIAFVLAFFGAYLGEKVSAKLGNKYSKRIFKGEL